MRALALRTMGCIRVDRITDYLCLPLLKALKDENAYVRKTAVLCASKIFVINPELAEEHNFVEKLQELLVDSNPMVVANVVASLTEIQDMCPHLEAFCVNQKILSKLLSALNECTEWGQICILDAFAEFEPENSIQAEMIVEKVVPRLQHVNISVVLSAIKVIIIYSDYLPSDESRDLYLNKISPCLVTLMSSFPEAQYVALRNVSLILKKYPKMLGQDIKLFFCKYNDPLYVKLEKLEILSRYASESTLSQILGEMKEYTNEVDIEFVKKSIQVIGSCALISEAASDKSVTLLLDLISFRVPHVVESAIVELREILRMYSQRYETLIPTLASNYELFANDLSKEAFIWILGEYGFQITNASDLIDHYLQAFLDECHGVQLQIITACTKLFLNDLIDRKVLEGLFQTVTKNCINPDIRDRMTIYWRLVTSSDKAKAIVLASKKKEIPKSADEDIDILLCNLSSLASVFHQPPDKFVSNYRSPVKIKKLKSDSIPDFTENVTSKVVADLLDLDLNSELASPAITPAVSADPMNLVDLMTEDIVQSPMIDDEDFDVFIDEEDGAGCIVSGKFIRTDQITLWLKFESASDQVLNSFAIQFNKNS